MRTRSVRAAGLLLLGLASSLALVACGGGDSGGGSAAATTAPAATATEAHDEDSDALIKGMTPAAFFAANCATCHGQKREGGVGLPLTPDKLTQDDAFYADVIKNGRDGTGMTMMGTILGMSDEEIATLVRFLKTDQP